MTKTAPSQEQLFRLLVSSVKDYAIFMLDPQGIVTSWNAGAQRIKGYLPHEIIGKHFSTFYPPEDQAKPPWELEVAARDGRFEEEGWRLKKDGSRFWASVVITAVRDDEGTLLGFAKVTRDMTERRRADEELIARADQQAAVARLGIVALERRDHEDLMKEACLVIVETLGVEMAAVCHTMTEGDPTITASHRWKDARDVEGTMATTSVPVHGHGSLLVRSVAPRELSKVDVAFLQAVANVVAAAIARHESEEQVKMRDEFMTVASHELRTPLTALQLQLESVRRAIGKDNAVAVAHERIDKAVRHTKRLGDLVERLLDVSRLATGRLTLSRETFDLSALAQQVVDDFREPARAAGCALTLDAPAPVTGSWDRFRVQQVFDNLLSNATKYGRGAPIEVVVREEGDHACIEVRDQGIGVPRDDRERIFGRFERAVSVRHYGGLGLGLYLSRRLVEAHGGTISVGDGAGGKGASFVVKLPRASK